MLVHVRALFILDGNRRWKHTMPKVGDVVFRLAVDDMGNYDGHVLHVHAWKAIRKWTVLAIKTTAFVS